MWAYRALRQGHKDYADSYFNRSFSSIQFRDFPNSVHSQDDIKELLKELLAQGMPASAGMMMFSFGIYIILFFIVFFFMLYIYNKIRTSL